MLMIRIMVRNRREDVEEKTREKKTISVVSSSSESNQLVGVVMKCLVLI